MLNKIKSILPEKDIPKLGSENQDEYVTYSNGYNQALMEIEALLPDMLALIREEILEKVKETEKINGIWKGEYVYRVDDILNILK